jgi:trk system potassium uptake protein
MSDAAPSPILSTGETLFPRLAIQLERNEYWLGLLAAAAAVALLCGGHAPIGVRWLLAIITVAGLFHSLVSQAVRYGLSRTRPSFVRETAWELALSTVWLVGLVVIAASTWGATTPSEADSLGVWVSWSAAVAALRGLMELYLSIRWIVDLGLNPAFVLVLSFVLLITAGTLLLMLPGCRPEGETAAPFRVALFTATSACCVTGLNVVDPGTYWSRTGQWVILGLIQLGGLGIMTFGAFFAFVLGSQLQVKEQATFRDLLESERLSDVGGMIRSILGLTLAIELLGAAALSTLWPELPWADRAFYGVFHAVSAFCNAGFCLRSNSLMGWELQWQVWGVVPALIILGGLGFAPLKSLMELASPRRSRGHHQRRRLSLSNSIVLITTAVLLVGGTGLLFLFELSNPHNHGTLRQQAANAWFHSVTLRTAGFNTVDHELLTPASKLFGIAMMFIGASPGSTGGGVKTTSLALTYLVLRAVLSGRPEVEARGRTIPQEQVFRGLAVIVIALLTLMTTCLLIVIIENQPARFLDHLYESASALGTVGLSANVTPMLQPASQYVLVVTMLLGRVGPLTLIIALAGRNRPGNFAYPRERISLG